MDFDVSEEMSVRLEMIREFMDREVIPLEGEMLHGDPKVLAEAVEAAQVKVKQMGLWAPNHPVEFGGLGLSMVDHGLFAEAVGRSPLGMTVFGTQAPDASHYEGKDVEGKIVIVTGGAKGIGASTDPDQPEIAPTSKKMRFSNNFVNIVLLELPFKTFSTFNIPVSLPDHVIKKCPGCPL